jgi:hypothetical protein
MAVVLVESDPKLSEPELIANVKEGSLVVT